MADSANDSGTPKPEEAAGKAPIRPKRAKRLKKRVITRGGHSAATKLEIYGLMMDGMKPEAIRSELARRHPSKPVPTRRAIDRWANKLGEPPCNPGETWALCAERGKVKEMVELFPRMVADSRARMQDAMVAVATKGFRAVDKALEALGPDAEGTLDERNIGSVLAASTSTAAKGTGLDKASSVTVVNQLAVSVAQRERENESIEVLVKLVKMGKLTIEESMEIMHDLRPTNQPPADLDAAAE